jgi:hypothetical protein
MPDGIPSSQQSRRIALGGPHPFRVDSDRLPTPELVALIVGNSLQAAITLPSEICEQGYTDDDERSHAQQFPALDQLAKCLHPHNLGQNSMCVPDKSSKAM